jgi:uncharacterized protein YsxB (DUF464 family)
MIRVQVTVGRDGLTLSAVGHAGFAPRGQDVVCAGVSALLYGFVAYLEGLSPIATAEASSLGGEAPHLEVSEGDGELRVVTRGLGGRDVAGFDVTLAGLSLIAACYPAFVTLDVPTIGKREVNKHEPS